MELFNNLFFIVFIVLITGVLCFDLLIIGKNKHEISFKESIIWTSIWFLLALLFLVLIYYFGHKIHNIHTYQDLKLYFSKFYPNLKIDNLSFSEALLLYRKNICTDYITGFFLEYSLSIDNIFVILLILTAFSVKPVSYKTVLFWGIFGAIVLRFLFIFLGSALIIRYDWLLYIFGIFLLFSGIKMFFEKNKKETMQVENHYIVKFLSKYFHVYPEFINQKFWIIIERKFFITPLLIVLVLVEFSDLIFAFDSIPAIFSITRDPYIVFFSNIFAILGLRSLFFFVIKIVDYFRFLKIGVSILLAFVGVKLLMHSFLQNMGFTNIYSLLFIIITILLCVVASVVISEKK